jgi:hypothetical protein
MTRADQAVEALDRARDEERIDRDIAISDHISRAERLAQALNRPVRDPVPPAASSD